MACAAAATEALGPGFVRFEAVFGQPFTALIAVVVVLAGVVVEFGLRQVALVAEGVEPGALGKPGLLVVEGTDADPGGLLGAHAAPLGQGILTLGGRLAVEADRLWADRLGGIDIVGDDDTVARIIIVFAGKFGVVEQALFLHQPADKVQIALAVLHAVAARRVITAQIEAIATLGQVIVVEDLGQHIDH